MKTIFDYSRLRGKIKEKCDTQESFTRQMGMSRTSLSKRLNNQIDFSQDEILRACKILDIDDSGITQYFFAEKV